MSKTKFLWFTCFLFTALCVAIPRQKELNKKDYEPFISGGEYADTHGYRQHITSLRFSKDTNTGTVHICGGSILFPDLIVTAAHCLFIDKTTIRETSQLIIVAGSSALNFISTTTRIFGVKKVIVHPDYVHTGLSQPNDIALLELFDEIDEDENSRAHIPLADNDEHKNEDCTVLGWGGPIPKEKAKLKYLTVTPVKCDKQPDVFCVEVSADNSNKIYQGDSGGPLICNGKLSGVVSFEIPDFPVRSSFCSIWKHKKWILDNKPYRAFRDIDSDDNSRASKFYFHLNIWSMLLVNEIYT